MNKSKIYNFIFCVAFCGAGVFLIHKIVDWSRPEPETTIEFIDCEFIDELEFPKYYCSIHGEPDYVITIYESDYCPKCYSNFLDKNIGRIQRLPEPKEAKE